MPIPQKSSSSHLEEPIQQPGFTKKISRRAALTGIAGAAGIVLVQTATGRVVQTAPQVRPRVPDDPTKVLGPWASEQGERSPFEQPRRITWKTESETPHQAYYALEVCTRWRLALAVDPTWQKK